MRILSRVLWFSLLCLTLCSCSNHKIQHAARLYFERGDVNASDTLFVDIKEVVGKDFDECFIIQGMCLEQDISEIIGTSFSGHYIADDECSIVLLKDKTVIYQERVPWRKIESDVNDFVVNPQLYFILKNGRLCLKVYVQQ